MEERYPENNEKNRLLKIEEDHFNDFKSRRIKPSTVQKTFVAFANTDGGDLYIGIEDPSVSSQRLIGFDKKEDTNDIIHTLLEETEPAVENVDLEFINFGSNGSVLHLSIPKSPKVHYTSNGKCYVRINARNKRIKGEQITQLSYSKGVHLYEKQPVNYIEKDEVINSNILKDYLVRIGTELSKELFLRKQRLLVKHDDKYVPNVGCILLFDEIPQATLDTRCAIKVYRLRTTDTEYKREQLAASPVTIEGPIEEQIMKTLDKIKEILTDVTYKVGGKLKQLEYPIEAIKEILVNAVIHRDYSLNDDVHIKIYDNRIEIKSPGRLPGYITEENIYEERFSRNPTIVRMLHNLPNPLNHDIGEGLKTARNELKKVGLIEPTIKELENAVVVTIKHQKIASLEDIIMDYLKSNPNSSIANREVRNISGEDDVNKVKRAFQKLREEDIIEPVDKNARAFDYRYKLKEKN